MIPVHHMAPVCMTVDPILVYATVSACNLSTKQISLHLHVCTVRAMSVSVNKDIFSHTVCRSASLQDFPQHPDSECKE